MNASEAKQLKVGDVVSWDRNPDDLGNVDQLLTHGVVITWRKVPHMAMPLHFSDMGMVSLHRDPFLSPCGSAGREYEDGHGRGE